MCALADSSQSPHRFVTSRKSVPVSDPRRRQRDTSIPAGLPGTRRGPELRSGPPESVTDSRSTAHEPLKSRRTRTRLLSRTVQVGIPKETTYETPSTRDPRVRQEALSYFSQRAGTPPSGLSHLPTDGMRAIAKVRHALDTRTAYRHHEWSDRSNRANRGRPTC